MAQPSASDLPPFERLLRLFDTDRERAALEYEAVRRRLLRFFVWRECDGPEECVDRTFDRVARRLAEGQAVWTEDPLSYVFGVARNVAREVYAGRGPGARHEPLTEKHNSLARVSGQAPEDEQQRERRLASLDDCLKQLPDDNRSLVLEYYVGEQSAKIAGRQALAARLGLSLTALRLRVHRLRRQLEQCLSLKLGGAK